MSITRDDKVTTLLTVAGIAVVTALMITSLVLTGYFEPASFTCPRTMVYIQDDKPTVVCGNRGCIGDGVVVHGKVMDDSGKTKEFYP